MDERRSPTKMRHIRFVTGTPFVSVVDVVKNSDPVDNTVHARHQKRQERHDPAKKKGGCGREGDHMGYFAKGKALNHSYLEN